MLRPAAGTEVGLPVAATASSEAAALADGRQCRPRHERCVGSLREDSGRKLIFYPHRMGSALQLPVGMRIFMP